MEGTFILIPSENVHIETAWNQHGHMDIVPVTTGEENTVCGSFGTLVGVNDQLGTERDAL